MDNFDLISDLHIDMWPSDQRINFRGLGTSLNCIVAGDVSSDKKTTREFLYQLADSYKHVIFIDGNHEHYNKYDKIDSTCQWFEKELSRKKNIAYLWDSACVSGTTAIIGANGWWTFDHLSPKIPQMEHMEAYTQDFNRESSESVEIWDLANENAEFMSDVVRHMSNNEIIEKIVLVTHSLPRNDLVSVSPNLRLSDYSKLSNSSLANVLSADINNKVVTWCFGHYHEQAVDININGTRYVSNPRGHPGNSFQQIYFPKLIKI